MTMQFMLPELGEHVESAELIKILVSIGTRVEIDQPVLELETDKADFELPSAVGGVVKEIHVREGERVKVGQLLFTLDESAAAAVSTALENPAPAARQENAAAHAAPEQRQPERDQAAGFAGISHRSAHAGIGVGYPARRGRRSFPA